MNIVFTIQHPAHVHLFRNSIEELEETDDVKVVVRDKEIIVDLLEAYDIDHTVLADGFESVSSLPLTQLQYEFNVWRHVRRFDPDIVVGVGGMTASHVATLTGAKSMVFHDTEHATLQNKLAFPFADRICTPESYQEDIGEKQVRYPGFHELAYLHPDRYEPDPEVCIQHGIDPDEKLAVIRLVSWNAAHDVGHGGFEDLKALISELEDRDAQIVITAEGEFPPQLEQYQMTIPPHRIHDLLYYSDIFVGEGATMAIESAVLGTPAVFVSTLEAGVLNELETEYELLRTVTEPENTALTVQATTEMLERNPSVWEDKRSRLIDNKVDTTSVILDQIMEVAG